VCSSYELLGSGFCTPRQARKGHVTSVLTRMCVFVGGVIPFDRCIVLRYVERLRLDCMSRPTYPHTLT
jgi:hypothetical protein